MDTTDGVQAGWVDLVSGERTLALRAMAASFEAAIATDQTDKAQLYVPHHALEEPTSTALPSAQAASTLGSAVTWWRR